MKRRIAFVASEAPAAAEGQARLAARYGSVPPPEAEVIVESALERSLEKMANEKKSKTNGKAKN